MFVGETKAGRRQFPASAQDRRFLLGLIRDARFVAPARTASLLMAGVFAVFSGAPRVLLEGFGLSPITLGPLFAARCLPGVWSRDAGAKTVGAVRLYHATLVGLGIGRCRRYRAACRGPGRERTRCCRFSSPLRSSCSGSELRARCRVRPRYRHSATRPALAAALFGFSQMAGSRMRRVAAAILSSDPAIGLGTVLALTSVLALVLHRWKRRPELIAVDFSRSPHPWLRLIFLLGTKCARSLDRVTRRADIAVTWLRKCFAAGQGTSDAFHQ